MYECMYLINVAQDGLLDTVVFDNLSEHTAIPTADNEDLLRVGVRVHGQMCDHLLVRELVSLGDLDGRCRGRGTFPWLVDLKTRTSWYSLFSWWRTFSTLRVIAWPTHACK